MIHMHFTVSKTAVLGLMVACEWPSKSIIRLPLKTCAHKSNVLLDTAIRRAKAVGSACSLRTLCEQKQGDNMQTQRMACEKL